MKKELIYVASPYTHKSKNKMRERFEKVLEFAVYLIKKGYFILSPIVYGHIMSNRYKMPTNWEYWLDFDKKLISRCDKLMVLKLKGWKKSKGVQSEIKIAKEYNIPIKYIDENFKRNKK